MDAQRHDIEASQSGTFRILLVDDDVYFARLLGAVLEDAGRELRLAFSAAEALTTTSTFVPDVAILDIHMPIVDGHALVAAFHAEPSFELCSFIAISGTALDRCEPPSAFDDFFMKPLDIERLLGLLADLARKKATEAG